MRPALLKNHLLKQFENKNTCLITGAPGVGKTDLIKSVADLYNSKHEEKCDLVLSHPVIKDPTDYRGLGALVDGNKAEFIPFGDLRRLMEATKPTLCFLDDLGQANASVQAAIMQLLLAREIDGKKISDHVVFFAATNRAGDRAGVSGLLEPVKSRFKTIIEFTVHLDDWIEWAIRNNMPAQLVSFNRFKPTHLISPFVPNREIVNSASPRTIANVGELMNEGIEKEIEFEIIQGAAGNAFATEFVAFLNRSRDLPSFEDILRNPSGTPIPKEPSDLYAICGCISAALNTENYYKAEVFIKRLPPEYQIMTIKDALQYNPPLTSLKEIDSWFHSNSHLILAA